MLHADQKKLQRILQAMEARAFETTEMKSEHVCWSLGISELTRLTEHDLINQHCRKCSTGNCHTRLS